MIPAAPREKPIGRPGALVRSTLPTGLPIAVLCGITLAFYCRLWLPDLLLIKRDAFRSTLPLKQYLIERLSAGELPQWFPYEALGRPFIGVTWTGVFHPFTALYLLFPLHDAYRASTLLSALLAALGTFTLCRRLNFSRSGALLSGVAFVLTGYVVSLTDNIVYMFSTCMLPVFCAAIDKALRENRAWTVAPAIAWALVLLNGDIQTGYYYIFIAVAWVLARAPGSRLEAVRRLALAGVLAALLAGIQLGPAWAVFAGSERTQPALFHDQALHWSTHPLRLLTMLASPVGEYKDLPAVGSFFFGNPTRPWSFWAESLYVGVPVTGLAILGAWRRPDLRFLVLIGCFALLLSLGKFGGLYEIFYRAVPLWSAFRYPEKLMGVASFTIAVLAGAGVDALRAGNGRATLWFAASILCASVGLGLSTGAAGTWGAASFGAPVTLSYSVMGSAGRAFLFSAAAGLGMWIAIFGIRRRWLREAFSLVSLVAIVVLDLAHANLQVYHTGPAAAARFTPPLVQAIAAREGPLNPGRFRMISIRDSNYIVPESMGRLLGHDAQAVERRQALALQHNAQFHLETVYYDFPTLKVVLPPNLGLEAAARFNVAYYIGRRDHFRNQRFDGAFIAELPDYDLALFRNPVPAKPRAYLSLRPEPTTAPVDLQGLLIRPDFLNGEVDVIEAPTAILPGPAPDGSAVIERYDPEDVRVRVETPQPAVLILLDAYDQGWTATLDNGVEIPIMRANALVRAAVVPAGDHVVTFRYETPLLRAGAAASLTGAVICLAMIAQARQRTRRQEDRA